MLIIIEGIAMCFILLYYKRKNKEAKNNYKYSFIFAMFCFSTFNGLLYKWS